MSVFQISLCPQKVEKSPTAGMLGASGRIPPSLGIKPLPKGHHLSVGATYHAIGALGQATATGWAQD